MLTTPKELLAAFPVRKNGEQKQRFLDCVQSYGEHLGYPTQRAKDYLLIGNHETADYLLCADHSEGALLTFLEILRSIPGNRRDRICMLLFRNPFWGPYSYYRSHKKSEKQLMILLKDVGSGDVLRMFPTKQLNQDRRRLTSLYKACGYFGKKSILVQEKVFLPKWNVFPYAVHICSVKSGKKETYRNRLKKTESLDETNINILRAALVSFICCEQPK